jgi:hypothetical protein
MKLNTVLIAGDQVIIAEYGESYKMLGIDLLERSRNIF